MFHTIITLVYVIPNIYVLLRTNQLFISKGYRFLYTLIYLFIALFFPLVNLMPHGEPGIFYQFLESISGYLLPFYLHLFLFLLLFDVLWLINWLAGLVSRDTRQSVRFRTASFSAILFGSLAVVIAGAINFNTIRTTEYDITVPRKSSTLDHLTVVFVSDFHLKEHTDFGFVERYVKKVREIGPDLVLYGGDIVEGNRRNGKMERYERKLREITAPYGVFAVLGNHEYYSGHDDGIFFDRAGMTLLCDSVVTVDHLFRLAGRYDSHFGRRQSVGELVKAANDSLPLLLLDHRPTELEQAVKANADVQFSGHTHNGQMFPINLILRRMYHLVYGYEKIGPTHFFVSSGIRMWGPPVRTVGKSEIVVVRLRMR
jgi:predicted MPP superfamily phosphohydrolase